jgi:hypothetical protein
MSVASGSLLRGIRNGKPTKYAAVNISPSIGATAPIARMVLGLFASLAYRSLADGSCIISRAREA